MLKAVLYVAVWGDAETGDGSWLPPLGPVAVHVAANSARRGVQLGPVGMATVSGGNSWTMLPSLAAGSRRSRRTGSQQPTRGSAARRATAPRWGAGDACVYRAQDDASLLRATGDGCASC